VAARPEQASLKRAQQKLHGAQPQERLRAASALPQQELALVLEEEVDASAPWQQLGWAREIPSVAPQVERRPASE
jgi:hypothetical protein